MNIPRRTLPSNFLPAVPSIDSGRYVSTCDILHTMTGGGQVTRASALCCIWRRTPGAPSMQRRAAIDHDNLAGYEVAVGTGEIDERAGKIVWFLLALEKARVDRAAANVLDAGLV